MEPPASADSFPACRHRQRSRARLGLCNGLYRLGGLNGMLLARWALWVPILDTDAGCASRSNFIAAGGVSTAGEVAGHAGTTSAPPDVSVTYLRAA